MRSTNQTRRDTSVSSLTKSLSALSMGHVRPSNVFTEDNEYLLNELERKIVEEVKSRCATLRKEIKSPYPRENVEPRVRINPRNLQFAVWGIGSSVYVTYGYSLIDLPQAVMIHVMSYVARDNTPITHTNYYTLNKAGRIRVTNPPCTKYRTGKHKHIPRRLLGLYGTCSAFKRLLDSMYLLSND